MGSGGSLYKPFSGRKRPRNPETDWDDKPGKPRLVIPVRFGVFCPKRAQNPETDWDDKPGKPGLVIPVRFGVFQPKRTKQTRTGMTSLGNRGLSSQSVSGFSGRKGLYRFCAAAVLLFAAPGPRKTNKTIRLADYCCAAGYCFSQVLSRFGF